MKIKPTNFFNEFVCNNFILFIIAFVASTLILYSQNLPNADKYTWVNVMNESGITVQKRSVPDTNIFEFRGRGIVKGNLLEIYRWGCR